MNFGIAYIMKMLYSFLVVILLVLIYTYIQSLEAKGCACAMNTKSTYLYKITILFPKYSFMELSGIKAVNNR